MILREVLMLMALIALCIVMRPQYRYPAYFDCELSVNPWRDGIKSYDGAVLFEFNHGPSPF